MARIKAIFGKEPMREGEYPTTYQVGSPVGRGDPPVDEIKPREVYCGDHSEHWLDVIVLGQTLVSMSTTAVAEIHYFKEGE